MNTATPLSDLDAERVEQIHKERTAIWTASRDCLSAAEEVKLDRLSAELQKIRDRHRKRASDECLVRVQTEPMERIDMADANRCDNCHEYKDCCLCHGNPEGADIQCSVCGKWDSNGGCDNVEQCLDKMRTADEHKREFEAEVEAGLHPGWADDERILGMGRSMPTLTSEELAEAFREGAADLREGE